MAVSVTEASGRRQIGPDVELDAAGGQLWRSGEPIALRPKSWLVLRHLSERPGELVPVQDLLDVAWPGTAVTPNALTNVINEIRRALGDDASEPAFLQTVFRRGYRWIARGEAASGRIDATEPEGPRSDAFVGRGSELAGLRALWTEAARARRSTVFVGGDAGIGKTTLVAELQGFVEAEGSLVARGAAMETHGLLEPFLPFFGAIEDLLARERGWLLPLLERCAPSWLARMPWVGGRDQAAASPARESGASSMLGEGAALWEAIAARRPTLLVLEDLHLADAATVGLIAYLAERSSSARLLILGTWRAAQAVATEHPVAALVRKLQAGRRATALFLSPLSREEIRTWLFRRFSSDEVAASLTESMERLSEGNPLFLSAFASHAIERGILCEEDGRWQVASAADTLLRDLPDDLRGIVDAQLESLGAELTETLEVAAAAGLRFVAQDVGGGMDRPADVADALCHRLAQSRHFLRALGEVVRPDGNRSGEYEFVHSLYREACYRRLAPARRQLLHQRIALAMEKAHDGDCRRVASQLAVHFEAADDVARSVEYLIMAVTAATLRQERTEAHLRLNEAHERLRQRPQSRDRDLQEISLHFARINTASVDVERFVDEFLDAAESAERLAVRNDEARLICLARMGIATGQMLTGRTDQAAITGAQLVAMTRDALPMQRVPARVTASFAMMLRGEFEGAAACLGEVVALDCEPGVPEMLHHPSWSKLVYAYMLTLLGRLREAAGWTAQAVALSDAAAIVPSQATLESQAAEMHLLGRDLVRAAAHNGRAEALQRQFLGEPMLRTRAMASLLAGAIDSLPDFDSEEARSFRHWTAWSLLLTTAQREAGRLDRAMHTIEAGFRHSAESGVSFVLAELHRERGEIALLQSAGLGDRKSLDAAEAQFREALRIARFQGARLFELRAAKSLARILTRSGRGDEAVAELSRIVAVFDGETGFDIGEARALLVGVGASPAA